MFYLDYINKLFKLNKQQYIYIYYIYYYNIIIILNSYYYYRIPTIIIIFLILFLILNNLFYNYYIVLIYKLKNFYIIPHISLKISYLWTSNSQHFGIGKDRNLK